MTGQPLPAARRILLSAGFRVATTMVTTTDERRDERVLTQSPSPGTRASKGTRVVLMIERYVPSRETTG